MLGYIGFRARRAYGFVGVQSLVTSAVTQLCTGNRIQKTIFRVEFKALGLG